MKKRVKWSLLVLEGLLVLGLGLGIFSYQKWVHDRDAQRIGDEELSRRYAKSISYQGRDYPLKRSMSTVLLVGTDNFVDDRKQNRVEAFYNQNLADLLVVLVFDHAQRTVTPLQICRDTMCEVPWLSVNGLVGGTVFEQITLSHSFGSGKEDSAVNTRNTVQSLLFDAPMDRYLVFTMDTVPILNDLVGGVTVKLEEDLPALGEEYVRGAEIHLEGKAALRFVRHRDISVLDSNLQRMARHRQYLDAFAQAARAALEEDPDLAGDAAGRLERYLCTDLSVEELSDLVRELAEYELLDAVSPDGSYVMGAEFAEYYVDESSLWDCVRRLFCA